MIKNHKYDTKENLWKQFQKEFKDEEIIDIELFYPQNKEYDKMV